MSQGLARLFIPQDLESPEKTKGLPDGDLNALCTVADWIATFVAKPHRDLGRGGAVCPFVPGSSQRKTLWLAPERVLHLSAAELTTLVARYKDLLLGARPVEGDDASYKAIVVVLTDLPADRANHYLDTSEMRSLKRLAYSEDGVVLGDFHKGNEATAIYNRSFQPFKAPVPFLLIRRAVLSDWKFFLDNEEWLGLWAHRFGKGAVAALAEELRRTNWRTREREALGTSAI